MHLGVSLSIDDFGPGYSSLSYLRQFRVHLLKIDRSFVAGIGRDRGSQTLVRTIIGLANSLGLRTVAEGVETAEQAVFLREAGCDIAQGYYYCVPLEESALLKFLHRGVPEPAQFRTTLRLSGSRQLHVPWYGGTSPYVERHPGPHVPSPAPAGGPPAPRPPFRSFP